MHNLRIMKFQKKYIQISLLGKFSGKANPFKPQRIYSYTYSNRDTKSKNTETKIHRGMDAQRHRKAETQRHRDT